MSTLTQAADTILARLDSPGWIERWVKFTYIDLAHDQQVVVEAVWKSRETFDSFIEKALL